MKKLLIVLTIFLIPFFALSQKAYDAVHYTSKVQGIIIKFTLGNGYINASEIKATDAKSKKTTAFLPEDGIITDHKQLKFIRAAKTGKASGDYFIMDSMEDYYEKAPANISGIYYSNGTAYKITLKKG